MILEGLDSIDLLSILRTSCYLAHIAYPVFINSLAPWRDTPLVCFMNSRATYRDPRWFFPPDSIFTPEQWQALELGETPTIAGLQEASEEYNRIPRGVLDTILCANHMDWLFPSDKEYVLRDLTTKEYARGDFLTGTTKGGLFAKAQDGWDLGAALVIWASSACAGHRFDVRIWEEVSSEMTEELGWHKSSLARASSAAGVDNRPHHVIRQSILASRILFPIRYRSSQNSSTSPTIADN